jgi:hypothetical protein
LGKKSARQRDQLGLFLFDLLADQFVLRALFFSRLPIDSSKLMYRCWSRKNTAGKAGLDANRRRSRKPRS